MGSAAFLRRIAALAAAALVAFGVLALRVWALEIVEPAGFLRSAHRRRHERCNCRRRGAIISADGWCSPTRPARSR